jgi:hypothetical protein
MRPLINCLIENQALLSKNMYRAQQNINLNIDNGKLDRWNPEANGKIMKYNNSKLVNFNFFQTIFIVKGYFFPV